MCMWLQQLAFVPEHPLIDVHEKKSLHRVYTYGTNRRAKAKEQAVLRWFHSWTTHRDLLDYGIWLGLVEKAMTTARRKRSTGNSIRSSVGFSLTFFLVAFDCVSLHSPGDGSRRERPIRERERKRARAWEWREAKIKFAADTRIRNGLVSFAFFLASNWIRFSWASPFVLSLSLPYASFPLLVSFFELSLGSICVANEQIDI